MASVCSRKKDTTHITAGSASGVTCRKGSLVHSCVVPRAGSGSAVEHKQGEHRLKAEEAEDKGTGRELGSK